MTNKLFKLSTILIFRGAPAGGMRADAGGRRG